MTSIKHALLGALLFSCLVGCEKVPQPETTETSLDVKTVLAPATHQETNQELVFAPIVVIKKPFPAIVTPEVSDIKAADTELHADELVLGVEVNGEARAYPINMLCGPQREIVNDKLGGQAIAATW